MILPTEQMRARKAPSPMLLQMLSQMRIAHGSVHHDLVRKYQQWLAVVKAAMEQGLEGLTLTSEEGTRWAVVTADPQFPNQFRYTLFDRSGFFGHGVYPTAEDAVEAAFDMGYRIVDRASRLDEISSYYWRPAH